MSEALSQDLGEMKGELKDLTWLSLGNDWRRLHEQFFENGKKNLKQDIAHLNKSGCLSRLALQI